MLTTSAQHISTIGTAILDFGSGAYDTSVDVSSQGGINPSCIAEAFLQGNTTADNDIDSHLMAAALMDILCGPIVQGVGFAITGISDGSITGTFKVRWVWIDRS